jgi:hypothetical protein
MAAEAEEEDILCVLSPLNCARSFYVFRKTNWKNENLQFSLKTRAVFVPYLHTYTHTHRVTLEIKRAKNQREEEVTRNNTRRRERK